MEIDPKSGRHIVFSTHPIKNVSDHFYEDDGFFSDVPTSGSLSKSLLALNKFVKKNLYYDTNEECEDEENVDAAYFSKESSPNESVSKCDSDSNASYDKTELKYGKVTNISGGTSEVIITTDDDSAVTSATFPQTITTELNITQLVTNRVLNTPATKNVDNVKQTDDYKAKKLLENPEVYHNNSIEYTQLNETNVNNLSQFEVGKSSSFDNLKNVVKLDNQSLNEESEVVLRKRTNEFTSEVNRHTIHDPSEWVNRMNTYPDVYAPLPYKSPSRRYVESDVNIHYRCPVRHDPLPLVPERELARQQAEHMKRLYREQKRNKYLQENDIQAADIEAFDASIKELQDMQNRRHQDNFMPSQKTVVPLNRYDEPDRVVARALYAFNGQTSRELSFRKGDLLNVRRQIDSNWYEGEVHGRIGLFPYNYVELLKGDVSQTPKKPAVVEGRARAKFDFTAQTNLELPLKKGEVVVLTRRIDQNWWEGRNGAKTGIFPDSYVTVLQEPSLGKLDAQPNTNPDKPVASPAAHGLLNGSAKRSMGPHSYTPQQNSPALANAPPATQPLPGYATKQPQNLLTPSERGYGPPTGAGVDLNNAEPLYVDTNAEAVPYRAMYKYRPQNPDELELNEGDTVYVLEKCDDGWYVGSSQRTGRFGTFPGNYVERI